MCEMLGCLPSELYVKHPNMTVADKEFMMYYTFKKMEKQAEINKMIISKALGGK